MTQLHGEKFRPLRRVTNSRTTRSREAGIAAADKDFKKNCPKALVTRRRSAIAKCDYSGTSVSLQLPWHRRGFSSISNAFRTATFPHSIGELVSAKRAPTQTILKRQLNCLPRVAYHSVASTDRSTALETANIFLTSVNATRTTARRVAASVPNAG
jgi:hypothetical protein